MDTVLEKIVNFYANYQVSLFILSLIGLYALIWWSYENFKSILQIIKALLSPYFLPNENKSLSERFGKWAGKRVQDILVLVKSSFPYLLSFWEI